METLFLTSNENPLGTSPLALKAIEENIPNLYRYPEINPISLKKKLAEKFQLQPDNIAVSAGSVKMIDRIIKTFVKYDEEVLTFDRTFIAYGLLAKIYKRKCLYAPLTNFNCHIQTLIPLLSSKTKVIFIANPNNPTGTVISHKEVEELLNKVDSKTLVVLDEAYIEYVTEKNFPDSLQLLQHYSNLIILRTFSKIYGLAGLRVGYAIGQKDIIQKLEINRLPYSVNALAICSAYAALDDDEYVNKCVVENAKGREFLYQTLLSLGYNVLPSQGNFIYLYFDNDAEKMKVYHCLLNHSIVICNMEIFSQNKSLRISIGDTEANNRIAECL